MLNAGIILPFFFYLVIGGFAGLMSGLLWIGGGLITVPALDLYFSRGGFSPGYSMHLAAASSLAAMIFTTARSAKSHAHFGKINWDIYWRLAPWMCIGVITGAKFADLLPTVILRNIFAVFMLIMALRMFLVVKSQTKKKLPRNSVLSLLGIGIGIFSGLFGIGGGALTLPLLTNYNIDTHKAIAITAAISVSVAVIGTISFIITGLNEPGLPQWSLGYVYMPASLVIALGSVFSAPFGVRLAHKISSDYLKRIFSLFLLLTGLDMLWR